jgi:mRNA interferase RelE/StbE
VHKVELRRKVQKALDKLPKDDFHSVLETMKGLAVLPRPRGAEKVKAPGGLWRVRQGNYRIIYQIDDDQNVVTILRIGHRREIYREL